MIDHGIRVELEITVRQYVFLDCIYNFNCKKKFEIKWQDIEKATGFIQEEIVEIFRSLKDSGFLISKHFSLKTTDLWNQHFVNEDILPEIVFKMNEILGTKYLANSADTRKHIRARLKEGHTLQDFIMVIESRNADWSEDAHMRQYLRPATLFGTKFESYLQHAIANAIKPIIPKDNGKQKPTNFESVAGAYSDIPD